MMLQPRKRFTRKMPTRFALCRAAPMIVGKKYSAKPARKNGNPNKWNILPCPFQATRAYFFIRVYAAHGSLDVFATGVRYS